MLVLLNAGAVQAAQTLEYKIEWNDTDSRYHVFMRPTVAPSPNINMTAQVTILAPHATGADTFEASGLTSGVADVTWTRNSRADAPTENTGFDYLSFTFSTSVLSAFPWTANTELEVFSFANSGTCQGAVALIENATDPFNQGSNSLNTNPGNQFTNLGWGTSTENNYLGNYGGAADCTPATTPPPPTVTDSDGDTISDTDEVTIGSNPNAVDSDGDGIRDDIEIGANVNAPIDSDGDNTPDVLDADDDNDGIPTLTETTADFDGDGIGNSLDLDSDSDGLPDALEGTGDPDNDGQPNYLDIDSDGDGILDGTEGGSTGARQDGDNDGIDDAFDVDVTRGADINGDGVDDAVVLPDSDNDGIPDFLDPDSPVRNVPPAGPRPTSVPTLSEWALMLLSSLMVAMSARAHRRQKMD